MQAEKVAAFGDSSSNDQSKVWIGFGDLEGLSEKSRPELEVSINGMFLLKMLLVAFLAAGVAGNILYCAAFIVSRYLRNRCNIFWACIGLNDILMVIAAIAFLICDSLSIICPQIQKFLKMLSSNYNVLFAMVAISHYYSDDSMTTAYYKCVKYSTFLLMLVVQAFSCASAFGVYYEVEYDICKIEHKGNIYYNIGSLIILFIIPFLVTFVYLFLSYLKSRSRCLQLCHHPLLLVHKAELALTKLHLLCYGLFLAAWTPYLIVHFTMVSQYVSDSIYHKLIWLGVIRSSITSFIYLSKNPKIREGKESFLDFLLCQNPYESDATEDIELSPTVSDEVANITDQQNGQAPRQLSVKFDESQDHLESCSSYYEYQEKFYDKLFNGSQTSTRM